MSVFSLRGGWELWAYREIRQKKIPQPWELDGALRHRGEKLDTCTFSGNSKINYIAYFMSNSKGIWTPHFYPVVGN